MRQARPLRKQSERGVALFLALLSLLLIAALSAAILLLASGESTNAGKQRYQARVNYAAAAGLEEARARILNFHPNAFSNLTPPIAINKKVGINKVLYIINADPGETVDPTDLTSSNRYADTEYQTEFGSAITSATVTTVTSSQPVLTGLTAIPYKWVRITVKTEQAANADINGDSVIDNTIAVHYDGKRQNLLFNGGRVYRLTSLAVLPNGIRRMSQVDVAAINGSGFNYAIASGGECEVETASAATNTINGNVRCNSEVELKGTVNVNGTVQSAGTVEAGTVNLTGSTSQVLANGSITGTVTGGASPNTVSGAGTVTALSSPATATTAPLAANTMPNPDANNMIPLITRSFPNGTSTYPEMTCVGSNLVFNLGTASAPKVLEFTGAPITLSSSCGGITTLDPKNFPANVQFTGTGTIWFSTVTGTTEMDIKFNNNFGTPTTPLDINIIARPRDNSVGNFEVGFSGTTNNIRGLIYVQGEIETDPPKPSGALSGSPCPIIPGQMFNVSGSVIAFGAGAEFEAEGCTNNFNVTYNSTPLGTTNPPPGFDGLLVQGIVSAKVINWRDLN